MFTSLNHFCLFDIKESPVSFRKEFIIHRCSIWSNQMDEKEKMLVLLVLENIMLFFVFTT